MNKFWIGRPADLIRWASVTALCVFGLFIVRPVQAASEASAQFDIRWPSDSDQPPQVTVDDQQSQLQLHYDADKHVFEGSYAFPPNIAVPVDVTLTASYADQTSVPLFLRIRPGLTINATVYHTVIDSCTPQNLHNFDRPSGSVETALKSYFLAIAALQMQGSDACGDIMRKRVEKAWFDRSYEMETLKNYFRISKPAADASREYQLAYPDPYIDQDTGLGFKFANDWKLDEKARGNAARAAAINQELINALQADPHYQAIVKNLQTYTVDRLRADQMVLSSR